MNTRFDGQLWIGAFGVTLEVKEMETGHLLNTVKMLFAETRPCAGHACGRH